MIISNHIYKPEEINQLLHPVEFLRNNKKVGYANVACTIDIETSSFYDEGKYACMYAFVLGIDGKCIIGRTYDELLDSLNTIIKYYNLSANRRMIFYVHNLAYEFQFFKGWFEWIRVFSLDSHKPVQAVTNKGIELRCSYLLSGYSLASVGNNLTKYKVNKMVGDLDYSLIRHSLTPLTEKELGYILNDGLVVMAYIQETIENNKGIINIPLTKTGYVRRHCRTECMKVDGKLDDKKYYSYRKLMRRLMITSVQEYHQLQRAFQGGFTHANALYVGEVMEDVTSYDFTSSYPAVMLTKMFPMSSGKLVSVKSKEEFEYYLKNYCCLFDVKFVNFKSSLHYENPLSYSKCVIRGHYELNNGRVAYADEVRTTLTEQDYLTFKEFYKWDKMKVKNFRIYAKGYLPTDFVKAILKLYRDKTMLKGVKDREVEYMNSKEQLNSCYGMCATNICRNEFIYDGEWKVTPPIEEEAIIKNNNSKNRFLFYAWGIWVTAHARRNLFSGIKELADDYIYSDTDSIKGINMHDHLQYINDYNNNILNELHKAMRWHGIPLEYAMPKTINGDIKIIGQWDYDGHYDKFKTLGAKRYMIFNDGEFNITVSGLNKNITVPYLIQKYHNPFDAFNNGLYIPAEYTGKNIHTYIDDERTGYVKDYFGTYGKYHEKSVVHLSGCDYDMSMSAMFLDFLKQIKEERVYT